MTLAVVLQVAAAGALSLFSGPRRTFAVLQSFSWPWLVLIAAGLGVSVSGYYFGYRQAYRVEGGPRLANHQMRAVVISAFGGFLIQGGSRVDRFVLRASGVSEADVRNRSLCLTGLEVGTLSLLACGAGITWLATRGTGVPPSVSWPWAVAPVPGFALAFWVSDRYRGRPAARRLLGSWVGSALQSVHLVRLLFLRPSQHGTAPVGMAVFWMAEMATAWAGMATFGYRMAVGPFILGFATGMIITRRTGLLAGAGLLEVVLPLSLWYCGAPLPVAVVGTLLYRLAAVWPATALAAGGLRALKAMAPEKR